MSERQATTKTYKELSTGRVETCEAGSDVEKALQEMGFVEIDAQTGEVKDKRAALQATLESRPAPLNPEAKVHTEDDVAAAKAAREEPPALPTPEPKAPAAPAVPKKNT